MFTPILQKRLRVTEGKPLAKARKLWSQDWNPAPLHQSRGSTPTSCLPEEEFLAGRGSLAVAIT